MLGLLLDREGLKHEAMSIEDWTRENFTVTERTSGQQYRFVTPGPDLRAEEWQSCLAKIGSLDPMPDFVVASGSLPPGAPADFYGRLAKVVSAKHSRFVLDSSGAALAEGLRSGSVYLVKPSMRELRGLVGRELVHEKEQEEAAMEIVKNRPGANRCRVIGRGGSASGDSERMRTHPFAGGSGQKQSGSWGQHGRGHCARPGARHARPRRCLFRNRLRHRRRNDARDAALPARRRRAFFRANKERRFVKSGAFDEGIEELAEIRRRNGAAYRQRYAQHRRRALYQMVPRNRDRRCADSRRQDSFVRRNVSRTHAERRESA